MAIKYKWLAEKLRQQIKKKIEAGEDHLPTEAELCSRYRVSRQTVRQALSLLAQEGLIEKRRGSGSYITGRLMGTDTNQVKILITSNQEYIYPILLSDITSSLSAEGFHPQVYVTDNRTDLERNYLLEILNNPIKPRGILVEGCKSALPNPNLDLFRRIMEQNIPIVFLHNYYEGLSNCTYIKGNNYQGAADLVKHLHALNHTHIAALFPSDDLQGKERFQGYIETMRAYDLPINDDYIGWFHRSDILAIEKQKKTDFLKDLIENVSTVIHNGVPFTAIICYNDEIAYYLIRELKRLGIQVPQNFAVVSFDDSYLCRQSSPTISSMAHSEEHIGRQAAEMLINKIKGKQVSSKVIEWKLKKRESS